MAACSLLVVCFVLFAFVVVWSQQEAPNYWDRLSSQSVARSSSATVVSLRRREGTSKPMSEALTPEEETIDTEDADERPDEPYDGPDPEEDEKGDGSDEDQGT